VAASFNPSQIRSIGSPWILTKVMNKGRNMDELFCPKLYDYLFRAKLEDLHVWWREPAKK
jgi:hypothetical protein